MSLEELRDKAIFQNTIDIWIMLCYERGINPYNTERYLSFIDYLNKNKIRMQKFPLCIKESGGTFDRGLEKAKFLDSLAKIYSENSSAYTVKLSSDNIITIRNFKVD